MSEFTKGKWEALFLHGEVICSDRNVIVARTASLRHCYHLREKNKADDERTANARLIAAAPEMYELLKVLVQREYDNTVTALLALEAEKLLARIDGKETNHD